MATSTHENAPAASAKTPPARRDATQTTTPLRESNPIPEHIRNDPRWRAIWRDLLRPIEGEAGK